VQRLGARSVTAAYATKHHRPASTLAIEPAIATVDPAGSRHVALLRGSSESSACKHQLRGSLVETCIDEVPAGPIWLTVAIVTGATRVWINLWKPLIDSLGPILGERCQPVQCLDDRFVGLSLHYQLDASLEHDGRVRLWWGPRHPSDAPDGTNPIAAPWRPSLVEVRLRSTALR
jgi:hypothetical protein